MWSKHCRNESGVLTLYSKAMFHLATDVWPHQHHVTRIDWCVSACREYFYGTGLQHIRDKEMRRLAHLHSPESDSVDSCIGKDSSVVVDKTQIAAALGKSSADCGIVNASRTFDASNHFSEIGVCDVHKV